MSKSSRQEIQVGRRRFFSNLAQIAGALVVAPALFKSVAYGEEKRRGGKTDAAAGGGAKELAWPIVEPGKDSALAMRYYHSHAEAKGDAQVNKTEKGGVAWEKQACNSCSFYKKVGTKKVKVDGKEQEVEVGTCTIFPQKLVTGSGFCNTWAKKA